MKPEQPRLYSEFASWFHLLTSPFSYAEEAQFAQKTLSEAQSGADRIRIGAGIWRGQQRLPLEDTTSR